MHGKKEFGKLASDFRDCRDVLISVVCISERNIVLDVCDCIVCYVSRIGSGCY